VTCRVLASNETALELHAILTDHTTTFQTSTNAYTASKLPALPDKVRSDWTGTNRDDDPCRRDDLRC
jgi:hypothetical protein